MIFDFNNDGRNDLLDWMYLDSLMQDDDELEEEDWDEDFDKEDWEFRDGIDEKEWSNYL